MDVIPDVGNDIELDIKESDIRVDIFRSSGPGWQSVNTTSSAVRVTHIPTGVTAQCQNEKSQHHNKDTAMEAIRLTKFAQKAGADGALLITPYYNKPTQEGLYQHFKAIAQAVDMPLVPYNVPGRTGCNLLPATLARMARDFPNIVGVKEATGDLIQGSRVLESCPENFSVLSGDDFTALPLMALGGKGVISVTSNIVPGRVAAMCNAFNKGDLKEAARIHHALFPLHDALFFESNPIPAKTALALMGRMEAEIRLPLCPMAEGTKQKLIEVLRQQNLI